MKLYTLEDCASAAEDVVIQGATVHQQFLCNKCGAKQTIETPNQFFTKGKCEECEHITDLKKSGCNYMIVWRRAVGG